jgi:hypothetical protein
MNDETFCGACDTGCGGGTCTNGTCVCPAGKTQCQHLCTDFMFDQFNCGQCGNECPLNTFCIEGVCQ